MHDWKATHDTKQNEKDQTWYFVLADCDGGLEIMSDEKTQKEHLLGLSSLYKEINDDDYSGFEELDERLSQILKEQKKQERLERFSQSNQDSDSFEETNLLMENVRREAIEDERR